jgi:hypothetical protein
MKGPAFTADVSDDIDMKSIPVAYFDYVIIIVNLLEAGNGQNAISSPWNPPMDTLRRDHSQQ